jgi:predicted hydrolase (HD superfamily)
MITLKRAEEINKEMVTEHSLILHSKNVSYAMGGMAKHFGEDVDHWQAIGYLHDYDYEKYPEEHLQHTEQALKDAGLSDTEIRAILSHGYGLVNDIKPETNMEKSLYTVDELTGIIQAAARMRPGGITDMGISSFMKKFKDKKFAAGCDRNVIKQGCEMLGMDVREVAEIAIEAMKEHRDELEIGRK